MSVVPEAEETGTSAHCSVCACRHLQFPREFQGRLDNEWNKKDGNQVSGVP